MGPGTGGDKPRPYAEAEGGSVGADFISARAAASHAPSPNARPYGERNH